MHQSIYGAISMVNPSKDSEEKYITSEFIGPAIGLILNNIFNLESTFKKYFHRPEDMVICLDAHTNWRKDAMLSYKGHRKSSRAASPVRFNEVFNDIGNLITILTDDTPYRVVKGDNAEADDVILVLAERYAKSEPILIISSDKDMIQAEKFGNVKQYSLLTRKFVTYKTKAESSLDDWLRDHIVFGDAADEIPRIVDNTEFTPEFAAYLQTIGKAMSPKRFWDIPQDERDALTEQYDGAVFTKKRFGPATLKKEIQKCGSLDDWLATNPLYRDNYERNKRLILAEYIPQVVRDSILAEFDHAKTDYYPDNIHRTLSNYGLNIKLPTSFWNYQTVQQNQGFFECLTL